ncbi:hypothetical protein [Mycobacteroides chelonae]|uniref:hypothetical protein n=1 Tax=Mycobacteroides chelonae TaxID=1774 RepID=UPI0013F4D10F|nr:hypothetical protein [Mycobacteroides chelonae]
MKGYPLDYEAFVEDVAWMRDQKMTTPAIAAQMKLTIPAFHKRCSRAKAAGLVIPA